MTTIRPVFIAGCDQSGADLLGRILGTSRWSFATPESGFLHDLAIRHWVSSNNSAQEISRWLLSDHRFLAWQLDLDEGKLAQLVVAGDLRATANNLLATFRDRHYAAKASADVWIDYTADHFKHHTLIKCLFPDARFIHIVRDGRDVSDALAGLDWGPNNAYTGSRYWAERLEDALAVEVAEGDNCLRLRFEDLLAEPTSILREICKFIDIPLESDLLLSSRQLDHAIPLPRAAASFGRQSTLLPQRAQHFSRDFESYPASHLLLEILGYHPMFEKPPTISNWRRLLCYCHDFFHFIWNRKKRKRQEQDIISGQHNCDLQPGLLAVDNCPLPSVEKT